MEYTASGDMVNVAARVEGETEGDEIFITESTFLELGNRILVKKMSATKLKGKSSKIQIYQVLGLNSGS